jgi:hypothetical protein
MSVCCDCCVLSGRGLCDGLIIRSETECGAFECDRESLIIRFPWSTTGSLHHGKQNYVEWAIQQLADNNLVTSWVPPVMVAIP